MVAGLNAATVGRVVEAAVDAPMLDTAAAAAVRTVATVTAVAREAAVAAPAVAAESAVTNTRGSTSASRR